MVIQRHFYNAAAISHYHVGLIAYRPSMDDINGYYSEWIEFNERHPSTRWTRRGLPEWVERLTPFQPDWQPEPIFAGITSQGSALYPEAPTPVELLTGLERDAGTFLTALRQVGERLYAGGTSGNILRRNGVDDWQVLAPELIRDPAEYTANVFMHDLGGPNEDEIYFASSGGLYFWDGRSVRLLDNTPPGLTGVYAENKKTIWACGWNGALIRGNHRDGFEKFTAARRQMFTCLGRLGDQIYLLDGAAADLWRFDGQSFEPVKPELIPAMGPISRLSATPEALWVIGMETDLVRFDGRTWTRFPFPNWPEDPNFK